MWPLAVTSMAMLPACSCAVHYFDPHTGTEHLWGVGHLKMKVTPLKRLFASRLSRAFGICSSRD